MADKGTKLIVIDSLVSFACHDPSNDDGNGIPGGVPKEAPYPLLPNYGVANEMMYNMDIAVCHLLFEIAQLKILRLG